MKECIICYNNVDEKSKLNLICECKYIVHNECYEKWYIKKPSCIICHNYAFPPTKLGRREKEKYINNKTSVFAIFVYTIIIIYILIFKK
jgi:hypothetical protein